MGAANSRFGWGGVFQCRICKIRTRATGRGDNEHVELCAECCDLSMLGNAINDGNKIVEADVANAEAWLATVTSKGGDVSWHGDIVGDLKAAIAAQDELVAQSFPIGSIRAAVAAKGDAWTHQLAPKPMNSNHRIAEVEDFYTLLWCDYVLRKCGRAESMQIRAFSGIDDVEEVDAMQVAA